MRRCACPRKESMEAMPKSIIYRFGDRCRKRAYREKVKRAAKAAGVEVAPSLRAIRATKGTSGRDGHAETKPRRAQKRRLEPRLSYRKAIEAARDMGEQLEVSGGERIPCPDHPQARLIKRRVSEQVKPGLIDFDDVKAGLDRRHIELRGGAADEAPEAYKRLDDVLDYHADTIRILHTLTPLGVAMAGADVFDPFKD